MSTAAVLARQTHAGVEVHRYIFRLPTRGALYITHQQIWSKLQVQLDEQRNGLDIQPRNVKQNKSGIFDDVSVEGPCHSQHMLLNGDITLSEHDCHNMFLARKTHHCTLVLAKSVGLERPCQRAARDAIWRFYNNLGISSAVKNKYTTDKGACDISVSWVRGSRTRFKEERGTPQSQTYPDL